MAYNNKAKLKTLYVKQIFEEETNAEHGLFIRQIIERLEQFGIKAERKSVYRDIEVLREFGCDVRSYQRNPVEYVLIRRQFQLSELMLMVDAVQSSKALTVRQCNAFVTNIKLLANDYERTLLDRRIHFQRHIKAKADSVFGLVDAIHEAMRLKRKVEFQYFRRDLDGKRCAARNEKCHVVMPVGVSYADGYYYLTAWDDDHGNMVEYRLDMMGKTKVFDSGASRNAKIDHYVYDKGEYECFGRFGGEKVTDLPRYASRQGRDRPRPLRRRRGDIQGRRQHRATLREGLQERAVLRLDRWHGERSESCRAEELWLMNIKTA